MTKKSTAAIQGLTFEKPAKKTAIFYTHVLPENKAFAEAQAKAAGLTTSDWTDQLLTQLRTKKLV